MIAYPQTDYMTQLILGLQIANSYKESSVAADHDTVTIEVSGLTEADSKKLYDLGWHQDFDDPEYWIKYV